MTVLPPSYTEDNVFPAYQDRLLLSSLPIRAGIVETNSLEYLSESGLQLNFNHGKAFVEQTNAIEESSNKFYNGLYNVCITKEVQPYNNVEVSSVNPQIAQIILRVYDTRELGIGGSSYARLEWLNGAPNAGATEAHIKEGKSLEFGAASLPTSSLLLYTILVPKNATKASEFYIQNSRVSAYRFPLTFHSVGGNFMANTGENIIALTENAVITLPLVVNNAIVGVNAAANNIKVSAATGEFVEGDFSLETSFITLSKGQHVIVQGFENGWAIIAGEPKREQVYTAKKTVTMVEAETGIVPSSSRSALFSWIIKMNKDQGAIVKVAGKEAAQVSNKNEKENVQTVPVEVLPGQATRLSFFVGEPAIIEYSYILR